MNNKPIAWICPVCRKTSWADTPEQDAAPEHVAHRGFDIGKCGGKMIPVYMPKGDGK